MPDPVPGEGGQIGRATEGEPRTGDGVPQQVGLAVSAVIAHLEREYGRARLLRGDERKRTAEALGCFHRAAVIDIGRGRLATVGPRGGGLRIHDLGEASDA